MPSLAGYPWEQGTVSLYASWMILALTIFVGLVAHWPEIRRISFDPKTRGLILLAVLCLAIPTALTTSWTATGCWWINTLLLFAFGFVVIQARVPWMSFGTWFIISLIPHVLLSFYQSVNQDISAVTALGIANHHPWVHGTSVVEHGLYRVLRAYGGFPHPNILGGWLAVGLTVLPFLFIRARTSASRILFQLVGAFLIVALVFSFSRGGWLAAALGCLIACVMIFVSSGAGSVERLRIGSLAIAMCLAGILVSATQWDHLIPRFQPSGYRLEQFSLTVRGNAIQEGMEAFAFRQLGGWGPGAGLYGISLARVFHPDRLMIAPEPPHVVPLVALVELGAVGMIGAVILIYFLIRKSLVRIPLSIKHSSRIVPFIHPLCLVLIALAASDHYLWTLWAGQSLFCLVIVMLWLDQKSQEAA